MLELTTPKDICVGIDLHKDTMTIAVLNRATGEIIYRRIACKCRQ